MSVNLHTGLYQTRPHVIHLLGREVVSKAKTPLREPWSLAGVGLGDVEEPGRAAGVGVTTSGSIWRRDAGVAR